MVVKGRLLRFSSLCIAGIIAITANKYGFFINEENISSEDGIESKADGSNLEDKVIHSETYLVELPFVESNPDVLAEITGEKTKEQLAKEAKEATEKKKADEEKKLTAVKVDNPVKGIDYSPLLEDTYKKYGNVGFAKVDNYLNIRKKPKNGTVVGKMQNNCGCNVLDTVTDSDGQKWYKIESGEITGYVAAEFIITGNEAVKLISKLGRLVVVANVGSNDALNVREKASTDAKVKYQIRKGEELEVVSTLNGWIEVDVGMGDDKAYVSSKYVKMSFELIKAYADNESSIVGISSSRAALVAEARSHLGGRYRMGGMSYSTGVDCSGFMKKVYQAACGVSLGRSSRDQASGKGKTLSSASELRPGDLVFYSNGTNICHVAMYIGNNLIIHASTERDGIKISNMYYSKPAKFKNVLGD